MNSTPVEFERLLFGFIDKQAGYAGTARAAVRG
jgi:hypothetical protein